MKKLHSLFIFSFLALTMFVGCQMPANETTPTNTTPTETPTEDPVDDTPTVADFVDATDYNVYKDGNFLAKIKGKILNTICKKEGFAKDTDYTIEGNKVTVITGSRLYDWLTPQNLGGLVNDDEGGNGNGESGNETTSETYKVNHGLDNGNYVLDPTNVTDKTYKKGDTVTFPIKTPDYKTPTGLYLVKTYVTDADNNAIAVTYKDHTVSFKMPDSNVTVRAVFKDVVCRREELDDDFPNLFNVTTPNVDTVFQVALRFNTKEYDNLETFGKKFIYKLGEYVGNKDFYIQLGKDYNVYDEDNPENCKYHENPVVIYNGEMYEPVIGEGLGNRYVDLDSQN